MQICINKRKGNYTLTKVVFCLKKGSTSVRYISNYKEVLNEVNKKYPLKSLSPFEAANEKLKMETVEHNHSAWAKQSEESLKLYKVVNLSIPISKQFADKLYEKMVLFIVNFKAKGVPQLMFDGYSVTFRTVVDDLMWSLNIHMPQGNTLKMSDLCRQIITDAQVNQLDESKYMTVLNTFEN